MLSIFSLFISTFFWVQVPQWSDDWSKCSVDVPDSSCHWYVTAPDNTFGDGFSWEEAPWFDANGLNDIPSIERETAMQKLQKSSTVSKTVLQ
tara:strand:- start:242 stop:517 length:276 start_codon:yes stop_codon:yes gene_type:complete